MKTAIINQANKAIIENIKLAELLYESSEISGDELKGFYKFNTFIQSLSEQYKEAA